MHSHCLKWHCFHVAQECDANRFSSSVVGLCESVLLFLFTHKVFVGTCNRNYNANVGRSWKWYRMGHVHGFICNLTCDFCTFIFHKSLPPTNVVCEGYVFTGVCLSTGGDAIPACIAGSILACLAAGRVCYPSMHWRWYPSMPCSRDDSPGGSAPGAAFASPTKFNIVSIATQTLTQRKGRPEGRRCQ